MLVILYYHFEILLRYNSIMQINGHKLLNLNIKEPQALSPWIHHKESLTDKLQAEKGHAKLELLQQGFQRPDWWAINLLMLTDTLVYQREIMMRSHGLACWYARTIIPASCYQFGKAFFQRLEQESVRNLIFDNADVHKVQKLSYSIDASCQEFYWVKKYIPNLEGNLWVRYSELSYKNFASFYLLELLLPGLE